MARVKKNVFVIIGSASRNSANQKLVENFGALTKDDLNLVVYDDLKDLPHFDPELSVDNTPQQVIIFRAHIERADGILI